MEKKVNHNIKFSCEKHFIDVLPKPKPSLSYAPDYFKSLAPQSNQNPSSGTSKRCVPFKEALSAGIIIPLWADMFVSAKSGEISINFPDNFQQPESIAAHQYEQLKDYPLKNNPYGKNLLKFINPWVIETDEGISCMFTSPFNHFETRFKIVDGIVDTDNYYNNINFPFIWTGGDGDFYIPKGTPLVQVLPFKREKYKMQFEEIDIEKRTKTAAILGTCLKDGYRNNFWHNKKPE